MVKINHQGAGSVNNLNQLELEKNRNWHWMWSTFYYHKKYKGFFLALVSIFPKFFSALAKTIIYSLTFNKFKEIFIIAGLVVFIIQLLKQVVV